MRNGTLLLLAPLLSLAFAPAPLPRPLAEGTGKDDLKQMQGSWRRVSCTNGAIPPVPRPLMNDLTVIAGNRITYDADKGGPPWTLTLGTGKAPRAFDIKPTGPGGGAGWVGIYELKGDTLQVCFTPSGGRPRSIQPSKVGEYLQVFNRQKR